MTEKQQNPFPNFFVQALKEVSRAAQSEGKTAYLVGGFVRDLLRDEFLLERDMDVLIDGDARPIARSFAQSQKARCLEHERFFTAKVTELRNFSSLKEIDFASSRREVYERPGALPKVELASLEEDLQRRDFSTNAMVIPVDRALSNITSGLICAEDFSKICIDQFHGITDLRTGCLRVLHTGSFLDDPTRIFRAARYLVRFQWVLENETESLLHKAVEEAALDTVSPNRIFRECEKIFEEPRCYEAFRVLAQWNIFSSVPFFEEFALESFLGDMQHLESKRALELSQKRDFGRFALFARLPADKRMERCLPLGIGKKVLTTWAEQLKGGGLQDSSLWKEVEKK